MLSFLTKSQPKINRADSLRGVPYLDERVSLERNPQGEHVLVVLRENIYKNSFLSKFMKDQSIRPKQIILDELGHFVITRVNNKNTVKDIIAEFADHFEIHPRESEASVVAFLNMLMQRHIVAIAIPPDEEDADE